MANISQLFQLALFIILIFVLVDYAAYQYGKSTAIEKGMTDEAAVRQGIRAMEVSGKVLVLLFLLLVVVDSMSRQTSQRQQKPGCEQRVA
jgi:hypothetical protein